MSTIVWRSVAMTYAGPPAVNALQATDLSLGEGEHVAVTGPSGSGKSTLLNILGLLDRPTSGEYLLDGVDIAGLSDQESSRLRATYFGFVFQRFHLIASRTALENVELGLMYAGVSHRERRAQAAEALDRVGLAGRVTHRPNQLSGGEQQRVAVARALARRPRFLLADEATGNLDSRTAGEILELLESLVDEGVGLICVTHDRSVADRARRQLVVLDGTVHDAAGQAQ
ncbi:MAG TPA: ABC transporter ATP-binding protein [Actinomycetota bacterium]|nr:ABC transporter ATP-binding protein [Actinomycetota bacterium]